MPVHVVYICVTLCTFLFSYHGFIQLAESCPNLVTLPIPHDFYFQATWEPSIIRGVHEHCKQESGTMLRLSATSHLCNVVFNLSG